MQQFKLHSKHSKDNPEKEFIGIVEDTGEQVVVVSQKAGTGRLARRGVEIIKVTVSSGGFLSRRSNSMPLDSSDV